jgi:folate-binding protein YgfZ
MSTTSKRVAARPRDFLRVSGPDAEDFLQRMLSSDVSAETCDALLLTPKGRIIAPVRVTRRSADDFLVATEPGLGETLRTTLMRMRLASKVELEPEEHASVLVWDDDLGAAEEILDDGPQPSVGEEELERARIEAGVPAWGKEIDDTILPAEAGLDETHISFAKGCYPGQEPVARLHYRGRPNRRLGVLEIERAKAGDEIVHDGKTVGRVTSAVPGIALGYVRREVPEDAELTIGSQTGRMRPARFERATSASAGQRSIP